MCIKASRTLDDTIGGRSLKTFKSVIDRIGVLVVKAMLYALCVECRRPTQPWRQAL